VERRLRERTDYLEGVNGSVGDAIRYDLQRGTSMSDDDGRWALKIRNFVFGPEPQPPELADGEFVILDAVVTTKRGMFGALGGAIWLTNRRLLWVERRSWPWVQRSSEIDLKSIDRVGEGNRFIRLLGEGTVIQIKHRQRLTRSFQFASKSLRDEWIAGITRAVEQSAASTAD
jgi:hypothetical protein